MKPNHFSRKKSQKAQKEKSHFLLNFLRLL